MKHPQACDRCRKPCGPGTGQFVAIIDGCRLCESCRYLLSLRIKKFARGA